MKYFEIQKQLATRKTTGVVGLSCRLLYFNPLSVLVASLCFSTFGDRGGVHTQLQPSPTWFGRFSNQQPPQDNRARMFTHETLTGR